MGEIKFLVMDVDGTLTDGKIYMGQNGEMAKAFDIKDGCGIFNILPQIDVIPIIITARESKIVENRCRELNIKELYQGCEDKLKTLKEVLLKYKVDLRSVAYAGDDIPDIPCIQVVKKGGGKVLCPSDAIPEIKAIADYISGSKAGDGAIRDCIDYLAKRKAKPDIQTRIDNVISLLLNGSYKDQPSGVLPDGTVYTVQEYVTKEEPDCFIETHRNHIDIQYMIKGSEKILTYASSLLIAAGKYDKEKDIEFWTDGVISTENILCPGAMVVIYNNQPHKGGVIFTDSIKVKKIVCKVEI